MKTLKQYTKKKKNAIIFVLILLTFGIGVGVYFGFIAKDSLESLIQNYVLNLQKENIHFLIPHFTILALIFVLSFIGIGAFLGIGYLFYEGLSIGFCLTIFTSFYQAKGFLFILLFILLTKIPFLIFLSFFSAKSIQISKALISWILYKKEKKEKIIHLSLSCLITLLFVLIYDLFLTFLGIKLIQSLSFLLI